MNIIITGGGGFIGSELAKTLLKSGQLVFQPNGNPIAISRITLVDIHIPVLVKEMLNGSGIPVSFFEGDIASAGFIDSFFPASSASPRGESSAAKPPAIAIFHLASIVSGMAEQDFDLAMAVNLDATRILLERCRQYSEIVRLVFTSSVATFGGHAMTPIVSDITKQIPQTTYGMTKLICELLINDYSRKGFLDGRSARLPTIFIRPGKPNAAASSFASSIFREPLNGQRVELPVARDQVVPLLSYVQVVDCLIKLMEADASLLEGDRSVNLPSTQYTVNQMIEVLRAVAQRHGIALGEIVDVPDEKIRRIVGGWPVGADAPRAARLGMKSDESLEAVIERFIQDFVAPR